MIYLDNSASSYYKPQQVINAVANALQYLPANAGRSGHSEALKGAKLVLNARNKSAEFLGLTNGNIIFTDNCTGAINMAIMGVVKKGHIVTTVYEHNAVLRTLYALKNSGIISLSVAMPNERGQITADGVQKHLTEQTFMVVVNHISNVTGAINDIAGIGELCRKKGIIFLVDGAQSVGYEKVNMDEMKIDLLAVAPHKGLHAPQGVGILAVREGIDLKAVRFGGTGTESDKLSQPQTLPEGLEVGTLPIPAIAGLTSAIEWTKKHENDNRQRLRELSAFMQDGLKSVRGIKIYSPHSSLKSIVNFTLANRDSMDVSTELSSKYGICVRAGLHCAPLIHEWQGTLSRGTIRASLGIDNTEEDIEIFINSLQRIANGH